MRSILVGLLFLALVGCGTADKVIDTQKTNDIQKPKQTPPVAAKVKVADGDFYNIRQNGITLEGKVITDNGSSKKAHRDAIQIIPSSKKHSRWQYMGGMISNLTIRNNVILSPKSHLQGVFMSDGMSRNITVQNNYIQTLSAHKITLSGVVSGSFSGNDTLIQLYPMRIGGGLYGEILVMSFKQAKYNYLPVTVDNKKQLRDLRFSRKARAKHLYDFDLDGFQIDAAKITDKDIKVFIKKLKALAHRHGTLR